MVGVDVHVEQPRRRGQASRSASIDVRVAALGEVRHGLEHDSYSRSVKAYYEARAPEYDDWWLGAGLFEQRDRPGWESERESLIATLAALQPVPTLDVACGTGFLTQHLPGGSPGSTRAPRCSRSPPTRMPAARFVQATRCRCRSPTRSFDRVFTSHFYGHLEEDDRVAFLAEARRVAPELVVVDAALRDDVRAGRVAGASPERRLALGGLQALLRAGRARRRARRRRDALRRPLVRRRPRVTVRKSSYRSLASLQRDNARCRACVEAGYPLESWPVRAPYHGQRAYLFGQAPGIVEGEERLPWRGRAGQTLRGWLGLDGDELYETFYCASVTRCYPGPSRLRAAATARRRRASRTSASSGATGSSSCCART